MKIIIGEAVMKKLYLSRMDKKIAGVCGGIGQTYDIDPTLVRLVFVLLLIFTWFVPMLVTYLVAWSIIPEEPANY